jgi:membrane fusion protein, multidrug efflux system
LSTETPPTAPPRQEKRHIKAVIILIVIFVLIGLGWFSYWWGWGRFYVSTEDAYVGGNLVIITPQVDGIVTSLTADNTDIVPSGRPIVALDKTNQTLAFQSSLDELARTVRQVQQMFEQTLMLQAQVIAKKAMLLIATQDYEHRKAVVDMGGVSLEDFETAAANVEEAFYSLSAAEHEYFSSLALVENTSVETHPLVELTKDRVRLEWVNLQRHTITSPVHGIVAQRTVQVGEHVKSGQPLLAVIPIEEMWVDANFREVNLTKVRVGQPAKVTVDLYGSSIEFHGKVVGVGGGTGSVFSILPPQNATGNWIKIVQRVPVRIALESHEIERYPLRLGLSTEVTIDIHQTYLPVFPEVKPVKEIYSTNVFAHQEAGVEEWIQKCIQANLVLSVMEDVQ